MKIIIINSPKHGIHNVLVDDEDYEYLNQFKWQVKKHRNTFYAHRTKSIKGENTKKEHFKMHRVILNVTDSKILVDHRDRDGLNNQRNNLRIATPNQNQQNKKSRKDSTSKYLGVFVLPNKKFAAQIRINKKSTHIGTFISEIDAATAYDKSATRYFGEFANLNFK